MSLQKNSKREVESDRFDYPGPVKWMNDGGKQRIVSNIFQRLEPSSRVDPVPTHIDFDLKDFFNFWYMGPNTYIEVKGQFQSCTPQDNTKEPPTPQTAWAGVAANDSANVVVEPNWFESMIKRIEVHHGGVAVYTSDEGASMSHLVNTYLYNYMNKDVKKNCALKPATPGTAFRAKRVPGTLEKTPSGRGTRRASSWAAQATSFSTGCRCTSFRFSREKIIWKTSPS